MHKPAPPALGQDQSYADAVSTHRREMQVTRHLRSRSLSFCLSITPLTTPTHRSPTHPLTLSPTHRSPTHPLTPTASQAQLDEVAALNRSRAEAMQQREVCNPRPHLHTPSQSLPLRTPLSTQTISSTLRPSIKCCTVAKTRNGRPCRCCLTHCMCRLAFWSVSNESKACNRNTRPSKKPSLHWRSGWWSVRCA